MRDIEDLFRALAGSTFRSRFRLQGKELAYLREKSLRVVLVHAREFLEQRLMPAEPAKDGRQTPMRGHPAFIAQHATACCCRGCLVKWHGIAKGRALTDAECNYLVQVIHRWLCTQLASISDD